jgi:hypothetical protein
MPEKEHAELQNIIEEEVKAVRALKAKKKYSYCGTNLIGLARSNWGVGSA